MSLSKREVAVLRPQTIFALLHTTSSIVAKTGSKLGLMMQPYIPLVLELPGETVYTGSGSLCRQVHERDRFTDFLLTVLRDALNKFRNLKLIIMSATTDVGLFT